MAKIRLGVVGCGDIAGFTALFARRSGRIRLAAACDANRERAEAFARKHGIPQALSDYAALLASEIDAVYIATPHALHAAMIRDAIAAGKAVLVEKPLTRTAEEGRAIAALVQSSGATVAINYQNRYDAACYAMVRAVQRGDLGRIDAVRINIPWRREPGYFANSPWHRSLAAAGGGTLITQGSHSLDLALWALGEAPLRAAGFTARRKFTDVEVEDLAQGILEMPSGALVQVSSSMAAAVEQAVTIEFYGSQATALYRSLPVPTVRFYGKRIARERPPIRGVHALQRSIEAFARWAQGGEPHLVTAPEALRTLEAVEMIYRDAQAEK